MMDTFLTALMHAAQNKDLEHAKSLIHKGADVNKTLTDGFTALMSATLCGKSRCMELLLEIGADVTQQNLMVPQHWFMWLQPAWLHGISHTSRS